MCFKHIILDSTTINQQRVVSFMAGHYTIGSPSIKRFYQADGYYRDRGRKMIIGCLLVRIMFMMKGV